MIPRYLLSILPLSVQSIEKHSLLMQYDLGYNIYVMQSLTKISGLVLRSNAQKVVFRFGSDSWKDRDEAAEKVYISRKERDTIQRVLKKIEEDEVEHLRDNAEFETKLREILKKYKIDNEPFFSELSNLHKSLN